MKSLRSLCVIATLVALPLPALAHHGSSGQFDTRATVEFTGKVTRVRLVNPHAYVYFDVEDDDGEVTNVRCELQSGSLLKRNGWSKELFEVGSDISIVGSPDRRDPTTCYMREITFENGVTATRYSTFDDDGNIEAEQRQAVRDDGTPNIDGNWAMVREPGAPPGGGGRSPAVLTEAGAAAVEEARSEGNPRFRCEATNIVMDWWFDQMVNRIDQSDDEIIMTYGFMDLVRTIHLDGDEMPDDFVPNRAGFSTGEWQGDTLVVTTTGFDEGWIMAPMPVGPGEGRRGPGGKRGDEAGGDRRPRRRGPPPAPVRNSTELTVIERFTLDDGGTVLRREYSFIDPVYLKAPIEGADEVTLTSDPYEPYACNDLTTERSQ